MKFPDLIARISKIDGIARLTGGRTLQQILSLRNWLMGASIVEFEQAGEDRAQYGQRLIHTLANALGGKGCQGLSASNLKNFRQLALAYPGLDAITLGHRLGLPIDGDHVTGIRQTSGEFALATERRQTSADHACSPFPSLARLPRGEFTRWYSALRGTRRRGCALRDRRRRRRVRGALSARVADRGPAQDVAPRRTCPA